MTINNNYFTQTCRGCLPYPEFKLKVSTAPSAVAVSHATNLTDVMQENVEEGLRLLIEVERKNLTETKVIFEKVSELAAPLAERLKEDGRLFVVGDGALSPIVIDLADKAKRACSDINVTGVVAGGDAMLFSRYESIHDTAAQEGRRHALDNDLNKKDTVILISPSDSSSFVFGYGNSALEAGATVYCFQNRSDVTATVNALSEKGAVSVSLASGSQTIVGSERLHMANRVLLVLGDLLQRTSHLFDNTITPPSFLDQLDDIFERLEKKIPVAVETVKKISGCKGCITYLSENDTFRETITDVMGLLPLSTKPLKEPKKIGVRAFLVDREDNSAVWKELLGKDQVDASLKDFDLLINTPTYHTHSKEIDDLIIAVAKDYPSEEFNQMLQFLDCDYCLIEVESIENDPLGILFSFQLKVLLNLISTGVLVAQGKIIGNRRIDVVPENHYLIKQAVDLIAEIAEKKVQTREIYNAVCHICQDEKEKGLSSVVKIVLESLQS